MSTIISANLKRLQVVKDLPTPQLAEKSGVSVRTIERIRSGKHVPDNHTIILLAKALGQKPEHLVEGANLRARGHLDLKRMPIKRPKVEYSDGLKYAEERLQERKDFTKFERELKAKKCPAWEEDLIKTMIRERKEWEAKVDKAKRQIIFAFCSATALIFGLYILLQLLPNPWL